MGRTVRGKHLRSNRRSRSMKSDIDPCACLDPASIFKFLEELGRKPSNHRKFLEELGPMSEESWWAYFTEERLEEILLKNLDFLYNEALAKLVSFGNCCGGHGCGEGLEHVFKDLRHLGEYSLAGVVCLLQQVRPHLSRRDALLCLLMSDLHVGRASSDGSGNGCDHVAGNVEGFVNDVGDSSSVGVNPESCKFHGGWGFGNGHSVEANVGSSHVGETNLQMGVESSKNLNPSASMMSLLEKDVAIFAAGLMAKSEHLQAQAQVCSSNSLNRDCEPTGSTAGVSVDHGEKSGNSKIQDVVDLVMNKFEELNLGDKIEFVEDDQKDEVIVTLLAQMKDLQKQVKDRKEWAHEKAIQAAKRLCQDVSELKILRLEREEIQELKKGKQAIDEETMKRFSELENALRKASGQIDHATTAVRRLQTENAEIRAEVEACKLSASESTLTCLEVAKREKKCLKKLLASKKQKAKLEEEITDEKAKIMELEQQAANLLLSQKEAEVKWRQAQKTKDQAMAKLETERHSKEAAESSAKRKLEALRAEIDIDFQRHKDDRQRLEHELAHLKASAESTKPIGASKKQEARPETIAKLLHKHDKPSNSGVNCDRRCKICMKNEVSVLFLPCAHQLLCASCSEGYGKKGEKATCPCCLKPIQQRIRVFGANS